MNDLPITVGMRSLHRHMLLGPVMIVCVLILVGVVAFPSTGPGEASFLARCDAAMAKMMAEMRIKSSHDVDKDFVTLMVPHHQGAIDMADAELSYGYNESLRGLAQEII
ncbi:MAG TPA: DUF305 domain-containing protein, partial [Ktedonobacteraceae bacterium]|nr:DUF305 domain-containing protein [Ktedonobacteraceae bacterium]